MAQHDLSDLELFDFALSSEEMQIISSITPPVATSLNNLAYPGVPNNPDSPPVGTISAVLAREA